MTVRKMAVPGLVLFLAGLAAGCAGDAPLEPDATAARAPDVPASAIERPDEAEFSRLSEEIPGFGGYFLAEDGARVMYLTEPDRFRSAAARFDALVPADGTAGGHTAPTRVVAGQYTFRELRDWRDAAVAGLVRVPGVTFVDLDEGRNRITVGVADGTVRAAAAAAAHEAGVPAAALHFEAMEAFRPNQLLHDVVRPLIGGLAIQSPYVKCSLGFNVAPGPHPRGFLTASHCTQFMWALDWASFDQPWPPFWVGREAVDPAPFPCMGTNCRYSDAALVHVPSEPMHLGAIAQTTGFGSIDIAGLPRFTIAGKVYGPLVGDRVHKVGRNTGWTWGHIKHTCVDVPVPAGLALCQHLATYTAGPGDSGAPVFYPSMSSLNARLYGLHWGHSNGLAVFSGIRGIEMDFGVLTVF